MLERIASGRTDLVFDWLAEGRPAGAAHDGASLIQWAAYFGDVSAIKRLLQAGATLGELGPDLGLNGAAFHGHWRLCQFLLEAGADPNASDPETGETPLHAALCGEPDRAHEQVVRVLLAQGADPNRAARDGAPTGCFMRDARTRGETPLHRAASFGSLGAIELLLAAGANLQARDARGDSPLSWGSWSRRPDEVLRMLCFEPHQIRPGRLSMQDYLTGAPAPANPAGE